MKKLVILFNLDIPDNVSEFYREEEQPYQSPKRDIQIDYQDYNIPSNYKYQEPVYRDLSIQEHVNRLNPVDIETYKISGKSSLTHIDRTFSTIKQSLNKDNGSEELSLHKLLQRNSTIDDSTKHKASTKVLEFMNEIKDVICC
jgi:hypothetical protein